MRKVRNFQKAEKLGVALESMNVTVDGADGFPITALLLDLVKQIGNAMKNLFSFGDKTPG